MLFSGFLVTFVVFFRILIAFAVSAIPARRAWIPV